MSSDNLEWEILFRNSLRSLLVTMKIWTSELTLFKKTWVFPQKIENWSFFFFFFCPWNQNTIIKCHSWINFLPTSRSVELSIFCILNPTLHQRFLEKNQTSACVWDKKNKKKQSSIQKFTVFLNLLSNQFILTFFKCCFSDCIFTISFVPLMSYANHFELSLNTMCYKIKLSL